MTKPTTSAAMPADSAQAPRKPYERPQIVSREPLESMAATCTGAGAKFVAGIGGCQAGKTKS